MTGSPPGERPADPPDAAGQPDDWIEVDSTHEGSPRRGLILEVLGEGRHTHFRVRWEDEHVSLFYPAEQGFIVHQRTRRDDEEP